MGIDPMFRARNIGSVPVLFAVPHCEPRRFGLRFASNLTLREESRP
jgi:hypothetical protein